MALLGVSERTLRKYRDEGYLPYTKIGDKFFYSEIALCSSMVSKKDV